MNIDCCYQSHQVAKCCKDYNHNCRFSPGCKDKNCTCCKSALSHIGGYLVRSLEKTMKCKDCLLSLHQRPEDPCPETSLILIKSYQQNMAENYNMMDGLYIPSGSMFKIMSSVESLLRSQSYRTHGKGNMQLVTDDAMESLDLSNIFPDHPEHAKELALQVIKRFVKLRFFKVLRDDRKGTNEGRGNYLHRSRIFQNL